MNEAIAEALVGSDAFDQRGVDRALIDLDGTADKSALGANAILGVSLAVARAAADANGLPLWRYLGGPNAHVLPTPMMNVINGGAHADNELELQEFMVMPVGAASFSEALRWGAECFHALKSILHDKGLSTAVGDEGGFAPQLATAAEALELLVEAIETAGSTPGDEVALAIDPAMSELFRRRRLSPRGRRALVRRHDRLLGRAAGPVPDRVARGRPGGGRLGGLGEAHHATSAPRVQLVGDDIFVDEPRAAGARAPRGVANAILIKLNQIGSLTETLDVIDMAQRGTRTACVVSPPQRRDGGHDDRRPRGRHERRSDQDGRPQPRRAHREVQPAAAHRGGAGRERALRGRRVVGGRGMSSRTTATPQVASKTAPTRRPAPAAVVARHGPARAWSCMILFAGIAPFRNLMNAARASSRL